MGRSFAWLALDRPIESVKSTGRFMRFVKIARIELTNFMSFGGTQAGVWETPGSVNVLVGQNNAGKTNFFRALRRLRQTQRNGTFRDEESHMHEPGIRPRIRLDIELGPSDSDAILSMLLPRVPRNDPVRAVFVEGLGRIIRFVVNREQMYSLHWGPLTFKEEYVLFSHSGEIGKSAKDIDPIRFVGTVATVKSLPEAIRNLVGPQEVGSFSMWPARPTDVVGTVREWIFSRIIELVEIRQLPHGSNADALVSPDGSNVADVLFSLKNSPYPRFKARYREVLAAFRDLFPGLELDAVRRDAGSAPHVVVDSTDSGISLRIDDIGSGIGQLITLLTHMIGDEGRVLLVDTPESNLHPLAVTKLRQLFEAHASRNQLLVASHAPEMLSAVFATTISRVVSSGGIAELKGLNPGDLSPDEWSKFARYFDSKIRPFYFARAILFVEGPTEALSLPFIAKRMGLNFDGHGVLIVDMSGKDWYLGAKVAGLLGIPWIAVLDHDTLESPRSKEVIGARQVQLCSALAFARKAGVVKPSDLERLLRNYEEDAEAPVTMLPPPGDPTLVRSLLQERGVVVLPSVFEELIGGRREEDNESGELSRPRSKPVAAQVGTLKKDAADDGVHPMIGAVLRQMEELAVRGVVVPGLPVFEPANWSNVTGEEEGQEK